MNGMTVRELIEQLSKMNPDAQVHYSYTSSDYWRTELAPGVFEVEVGYIRFSDYHAKPKVVDEDTRSGNPQEVVIIR